MAVVSSNQYALWACIQGSGVASGLGTPAGTLGAQRFRQVAGDVTLTPDYGSENYSNLTRFTERMDYVNSVLGQGSPGIQAQPSELGYLAYAYFGASTIAVNTPVAGVYRHSYWASNSSNTRNYLTFWKQVGNNTGVTLRQRSHDCVIGSFQIEGSTANKVVRVTPTVISLNPGYAYLAAQDPVDSINVDDPFLYTEGAANYKFAGSGTLGNISAIRGASQFSINFNENLSPIFGDDVTPFEVFPGQSEVAVATTMILDATGLLQYNSFIWGTTTPTASLAPTRTVPATGAYQVLLQKGTTADSTDRRCLIEVPGIRWAPDAPISPNPDGGATELALAGVAKLLSDSAATTNATTFMAKITIDTGAPLHNTTA